MSKPGTLLRSSQPWRLGPGILHFPADGGIPPLVAPPGPRPPSNRCQTKGCIFPVEDDHATHCPLHTLTEAEPKHFESLQPSLVLLEQAKFGLPDPEYEDTRARDRRRLADLRERQLEEVA